MATSTPLRAPEPGGRGGGGGGPQMNKSPFIPRFNDVFTFLPQGHEKALKQAFYNTATILLVILVLVAVIAVYFVLEPFLRPLLWAVLVGSALHPFKRRLTRATKEWLSELKGQQKPVTIGSVTLPFSIINWMINMVIGVVKQYAKLLIFIFVALLTTHLIIYYFRFTHRLLTVIHLCFQTILSFFAYLQSRNNTLVIGTFAAAHLLVVSLWWSPSTQWILTLVSPFVLVSVACQLVAFSGPLGLSLVIFFVFLFFVGILSSLFGVRPFLDVQGDQVDSVHQISLKLQAFIHCISYYVSCLLPSHQVYSSSTESSPSEEAIPCEVDSNRRRAASDSVLQKRPNYISTATSPYSPMASPCNSGPDLMEPSSKRFHLTNAYLYALLWTILLAQVWLQPTVLLLLLPLPLSVLVIKWFWKRINSSQRFHSLLESLKTWFESRKDALLHPSLRTVYQYLVIGDKMVANLLEKSLDCLCSLSVMFTVIICVLFAAAFLMFQIYGESIHLVNLMSNIVNSTLVNNPELSQFLPEGLYGEGLLDEMIGNAYLYGRKWLKRTVRNALNVGSDDNSLNVTQTVEKQLLEVWDRAYNLWLSRNSNSSLPDLKSDIIRPILYKGDAYNWDKLFDALKTLNFSLCFHVIKENIDVVVSVMDSIWMVLKGNVTLLFSAFTAVFSLLLSGSSAILNLCLNFIVFSTSLFYLLAASGDQYKPVELASKLFPSASEASDKSSNKFGKAVEEAINSVFAASLKMTSFYGLYTWLIHTLFETRLVYIPSVLAAVFGAVPFLGAYWASIPGVIELWLVNGQSWKSLIMLLAAILPSNFVDSAIYSEIKGAGHPYLTGLAIAGGVFYLGFEGALFGPILLCCLFVAMNIYTSVMADSTSVTPIHGDQSVRRPILKRVMTSIQ